MLINFVGFGKLFDGAGENTPCGFPSTKSGHNGYTRLLLLLLPSMLSSQLKHVQIIRIMCMQFSLYLPRSPFPLFPVKHCIYIFIISIFQTQTTYLHSKIISTMLIVERAFSPHYQIRSKPIQAVWWPTTREFHQWNVQLFEVRCVHHWRIYVLPQINSKIWPDPSYLRGPRRCGEPQTIPPRACRVQNHYANRLAHQDGHTRHSRYNGYNECVA